MATLTATPDPGNVPPRVGLDLSGMTGSTVTITRTDAAGNSAPVRTASGAELSGGAWVGDDYEAQFAQPVTYTAVSDDASTADAGPVTLAVDTPWLLHAGVPALSQPIRVQGLGDRTRGTNQALHVVLGRARPVVITDWARHDATFDLTVRTVTLAEEAALADLLADASPLLLQIVYPGIARALYEWVSVGDVTQADLVPWAGNTAQAWTLPCTVVDAPSGLLQAQRTWQQVVDAYATWQAVADTYATWRDVLLDSRSA